MLKLRLQLNKNCCRHLVTGVCFFWRKLIMVIGNYKYGISRLPDDCMAYKDGYKYGAYKESINDKNDAHITGWFKTKDEIQKFVNKHREYGKEV